jgi:DNA repair protein RadD
MTEPVPAMTEPVPADPFKLLPHQVTAVDRLRQALLAAIMRVVLACPTGFGKTIVALHMVRAILARGERVIFTVPRLSLIDQTVARFIEGGIPLTDIGVIQADHHLKNWNAPLLICSIDTLRRRVLPLPTPWVIIDECHIWRNFYATWFALTGWKATRFVGLSATPWTKGLGKHWQALVIGATTAEMIPDGHLCDYRAFGPSVPDLAKCRTTTNACGERDYREDDLAKVMQDRALVADVVNTWKDKAEGRPTLCFAVNRAHARVLEENFRKAGVPVAYIDAHTKPAEREAIRVQFHNGSVHVVVSIGCLTTGVDWDVRCISLCRPTKSKILYVQMIGRGLRAVAGKDYLLLLDHTDTVRRLGFVEDIHQEDLDDGSMRRAKKAERKEPLPKDCPSCGALKRPQVRKCPACGFEAKPQSNLVHVDGELAELQRGKVHYSREVKQQWYSELLGFAQERGYRPGWVAHAYRKKFGCWPRGLTEHPTYAGPQVRGYVRHILIAHAKGQARPTGQTGTEAA